MAINLSRRRKRGDREVLDEPNGTIMRGSNQPRLRGQPLNATGLGTGKLPSSELRWFRLLP